jgi:hypothetical protein
MALLARTLVHITGRPDIFYCKFKETAMNKTIITSIIFVLVTAISGCATKSKEQVLQSTLRAYERVLRWGDITQVNRFRKEPAPFSSIEKRKLGFIKVTGYTTRQVIQPDASTVIVDVKLRYYNEQFAREKTLDDRQRWEYDESRNLWFITSPVPRF